MNKTMPLIAPKHISAFTPEEYHSYVSAMYALRVKRGTKPASPIPGLSVSRSKTGTLTIRRTKTRAFGYVTLTEIKKLAEHVKCSQAELWNAFKAREFIIAKDRITAEHTLIKLREEDAMAGKMSSSKKKPMPKAKAGGKKSAPKAKGKKY